LIAAGNRTSPAIGRRHRHQVLASPSAIGIAIGVGIGIGIGVGIDLDLGLGLTTDLIVAGNRTTPGTGSDTDD
jgi:hypothetical protein